MLRAPETTRSVEIRLPALENLIFKYFSNCVQQPNRTQLKARQKNGKCPGKTYRRP